MLLGASMAFDEQFVHLIASHQLALKAFLRTLLRQEADVEDVLQESNLALWRKRHEYDSSRSFLTWACQFARLQSLSHMKAEGRKPRPALTAETLEDLARLSLLEGERADQKQEALLKCVEQLSADQQKMLRARYQRNISVNELGEQRGKKPNTISMILYRIRNLLKECIERSLKPEVV